MTPTFVNLLHVVVTEVKDSEASCSLEISWFEVMDGIMRQINLNNIVWDTRGHLS